MVICGGRAAESGTNTMGVTATAYSPFMEPDTHQDDRENSPLIQAVRELRAAGPATRILIVAPGEAATAQVQTQLAFAGQLGVTVCGPDALLPNVLQPGSQLAASRVRTAGYWRELVAQRYGAWTRGRQHELAIELFTADLTSSDSAPAADGPVAQLLVEGSGEDTASVVDSLSVRPPAVVLYGFDTEEAQVDLPSPLDVLIPQLEMAGVTVTSARPPPQHHLADSLFATYTGSASCFLRTHHFWLCPCLVGVVLPSGNGGLGCPRLRLKRRPVRHARHTLVTPEQATGNSKFNLEAQERGFLAVGPRPQDILLEFNIFDEYRALPKA